ncbi:type II toxin-antitoxin system HipA family toxin [Brevibacterium marinum]|uniref:Serine/threonine-protein kinase HipA n=1 Tax=Brevibacterium marinum TaxID=418643 RepID=A0A846S9G4_9MICO|nr:type II toxin-antitoxin system HipA family toxin [Brevibacterium marinum]NJC58681.1 serine/threonine-protein kinase HipA [Brevibacterium marinum]
MSEQIRVEMDGDGQPLFVGTAYFHISRTQISTTFKYADEYLTHRGAYSIDPELPLSTAPFTVPGLPGAFGDCAPDRWGRNLVAKQHRKMVSDGAARDRRLTEVDYLLGVSDTTRQGALRFRRSADAEHLGADGHVPKMVSLPELQRAADDAAEGSHVAIKRLLDAGTGSLGGARPKASVAGDDGSLMIAKFSRSTDEWNVIGWEALALELAMRAGIDVPKTRLLSIEDRPVLVLGRFDRFNDHRIGYMSAMTGAGLRDGDPADYLDIVEAIEDVSRQWRSDCAALYRRVAFSVAIHNTDDHLRNHGFLRGEAGWELSPVFDINPEPSLVVERQTAINGATEADQEPEALLELAPLCHLTTHAAREILNEVAEAVAGWRNLVPAMSIPSAEKEAVGDAIDVQLGRIRDVLRRAY